MVIDIVAMEFLDRGETIWYGTDWLDNRVRIHTCHSLASETSKISVPVNTCKKCYIPSHKGGPPHKDRKAGAGGDQG